MLFHLSMNHYALLLTQIYCRLKVGLYNVICSGCFVPPHSNVWSCGILCRLVIGFGFRLDFLSILMVKKGFDPASVVADVRQLVASGHICLGLAGIRWAEFG